MASLGSVVGAPAPADRRLVPWRRALLVGLVLVAVALAWSLARPQPALVADPALARLLRGMAVLKAVIAVVALALAWWRAGRPIAPWRLCGYALGSAVLAAAAVIVWQLAVVAATSVVFHATLVALALLALGDGPVRGDGAAVRRCGVGFSTREAARRTVPYKRIAREMAGRHVRRFG